MKLGDCPAMGFPAIISEWEQKRIERDSGADLAAANREKCIAVAMSRAVDAYTVKQVCFDYTAAILCRTARTRAVVEVRRLLKAIWGRSRAFRPRRSPVLRFSSFSIPIQARNRNG